MSSVKTENAKSQAYWRSLDELAQTPEFQSWVGREFPDISAEVFSPVTRRRFLSLMGASFALAGATGCNLRRPEEHIMPYTRLPEDVLPGRPNQYATTLTRGGHALGLLVQSDNGRPTKIEGNPAHPSSMGGADAFTLASILHLYDPDRSHGPVKEKEYAHQEDLDAFLKQHFSDLRDKRGAGLAILSEPDASPTLGRLRAQLAEAMPQARWYTWAPLNDDAARMGSGMAFGRELRPVLDLGAADVVLSLDSDFLMDPHAGVANARKFASKRRMDRPEGEMSRLYVAEGRFSVTGAAADHRLRIRASDVEALGWALAAELEALGVVTPGLDALRGQMGQVANLRTDWVKAVAADLADHKGASLVVAGNGQPAALHALVAAINEALGNTGRTVGWVESTVVRDELNGASIGELSKALNAGAVDTLVILGGNPVYDAPADLDFAAALAKASTSVHLSQYWDETGMACRWHVPRAHFLEAWGDARAIDGTASVVQPLIEPLHGGLSDIELVARILGLEGSGYDLVRETWTGTVTGDFEKEWRSWLHAGVIPATSMTSMNPAVDGGVLAMALADRKAPPAASSKDDLEIQFVGDYTVYDGRYTNNAWLQEVPDPVSNLVWDNAAYISMETARGLGVTTGDMVSLSFEGRSLDVPVMVQPGQADNVVVLPLGYGRLAAGSVGNETGFNGYKLRSSQAPWFGTGAKIARSSGTYTLATTAEHYALDLETLTSQMEQVERRQLVREATVEEYRKEPRFAEEAVEIPHLESIWGNSHEWNGQQWGMVIDLNACIGCNACTVACQSENNIAVVGKEQVNKGREMSWIRLDRYYKGSVEDPQMVYQPIACMHCENAPCETVCPVNATAHGNEGTNDMAYNRCIGTRYCANNCPFKVRRFNYLDWRGNVDELVKMVHNPDVTVRMRGVMEKCTYCIQRIHRARRAATVAGQDAKNLPDGAVTVACEQACPAGAITFGNINDPNSRVARLKKLDRNYDMLAEINIRPRTSYLARIRNPNPKLG